MKKYITLIFLLSLIMAGCKGGDYQNSVPEGTVKYEILLNAGSCFVYTFQDPETYIWYICTSEGITPRLNREGSFY